MTAEELTQIISNPLSTTEQKRLATEALKEIKSEAADYLRIDALLEPLLRSGSDEPQSQEWMLDATTWQLFLDLASVTLGFFSDTDFPAMHSRMTRLYTQTGSDLVRSHALRAIQHLANFCPLSDVKDAAIRFLNLPKESDDPTPKE